MYQPTSQYFFLRNSNTAGYADLSFSYGSSGDKPLAGVWSAPSPPGGDNYSTARLDPLNRTELPGEDLLSGNFNWGMTLLGLAGRAGLDLSLPLAYNSLVWTRNGSSIKYDADKGYPGPGFRLGFPVIHQRYFNSQVGTYAYLMITPSGHRVELRQINANTYESADSSYLQLVENGGGSLTLRPTDGTQLSYSQINGDYRCTQIKDRNGNFITIANNALGQISTITDTLGRVVTFNYDGNNSLNSITQSRGGVTHTWATFGYSALTIQTNFSGLVVDGPQNGTTISVLTQVGLDDGSRYNFDYTSWGQVYQIRRSTQEASLNWVERAHTSYDLPLNASVAKTDCPRFSERRDYVQNWNNNAEAVTAYVIDPYGSGSQVTMPDNTIHKELFETTGWRKGLAKETQAWSENIKRKWTTFQWTQDNESLAYRLNPRPTETNVYDEAGNRRRSTVSYTSFGLPRDAYQYAADATTVLRRTHTDYNLTSTYTSRRIIGLPSAQFLYEGNTTLMSKVDYQYDLSGEYMQNLVGATQHDDANYGSSFIQGRGNLCVTRRYDVSDPDNTTKAAQVSTGYNTAGTAYFTRDPLGHQITISYTDSFWDNVNRNTFAYPTTVTDADNYSSSSKYDYDMGVARYAQEPKGASRTTTYDAAGRVARVDISNGGYTRLVYPTDQMSVNTFALLQAGGAEFYSTQVMDGAGRVRATASDFPNSTGLYRGQYIIYDVMGRVSQQSNPTEMTSQWVAAGDDATSGFVYSTQTYDWQGRPRVFTNTDQTTKETTYGGCGCAGGEVVTIKDEMNRRQRMTHDVVGRLAKMEVLNWDGSVYSTRTDSYNARDQVTSIYVQQGTSGAGQETLMTYDGHGRLETRKTPIESSPTVYSYYKDDTVEKVTDPRGASASYVYNARHLVTGITYAKPEQGFAPADITEIPNVPPVGFEYDAAGNRLWMTDGLGRVDYAYDTWSRLESETRRFNDIPGSSFPLAYEYNLGGGIKKLTDPFGAVINYDYNQAGELTTVTGSGFAGVSQYASSLRYRAWGALKHMVSGDGRNIDLSYNVRLQITSFGLATSSTNSNYEYYADGRIKFVEYVDSPQFDRKYNYDHAGRLREGLSGSDARGEPYDANNPNPYKQSYTYDVFDNMVGRTNRYWTLQESPLAASYANDRNAEWTYDEAGNIKNNLGGNYKYDAAGRMKSFNDVSNSIAQLYDGDGYPAHRNESRAGLTDRALIYYVRSSVLGGRVITEVNGQGSKRRTYVYANGEEIARQERQTTDSVVWISRNPITGDDDVTRDPLGGYIGSEQDVLQPDYESLKGDSPTHDADVDPFDPGSGCTLDGVPIDCNLAMGMVNHGGAVIAPMKSVVPTTGGRLGMWNTSGGYWVYNPSNPMSIGGSSDGETVRIGVSDVAAWSWVGTDPEEEIANSLGRAGSLRAGNKQPGRRGLTVYQSVKRFFQDDPECANVFRRMGIYKDFLERAKRTNLVQISKKTDRFAGKTTFNDLGARGDTTGVWNLLTNVTGAFALARFAFPDRQAKTGLGDAIFVGPLYLLADQTPIATMVHEMLHIFFNTGHAGIARRLGRNFSNDIAGENAAFWWINKTWLSNHCHDVIKVRLVSP